jgi:hypothetical protein
VKRISEVVDYDGMSKKVDKVNRENKVGKVYRVYKINR